MLIRRLLSTTALVTVYLLAFPLTAVAQYAGQEEIAFGMSIPGERGGGSLLTLLNPAVGRLRLLVNDGVTWLPEAPVAGQSIALSAVQHAFLATFQLWQDSMNEWSALAAVRSTFMHTDALLPDSKVPFPDELWQARFGTTYRHQFANGWIGGGTLSVGSASDQPFAHFDDLLVGGMAFLRVPQGTHNAWLFSLAYSPTSELPIPLPGVAYAYQPSERLRAVIGLPLALMYRPWDTLMLVGSYMLLRTVYVRATYRLTTLVHLSVGFAWENDSYLLADRNRDDDRFFSYDKQVSAGAQIMLGSHVTLHLAGGYIFDRFYFEGEDYSDRHRNRIDVDAGPLASLQVQVRW